MSITKHLIAACGLALAVSSVNAADAVHHATVAGQEAPATAASTSELQAALRRLWHGHVLATREYAFAVKAGDGKRAEIAANVVVVNARQLADAVGTFYGKAAGDRMLTLLAGHWAAVRAMTDAGHDRDQAASSKAVSALTSNAGEISVFLSTANPYLPADEFRGLLVAHGGHHAAQIGQVMSGDVQGEQATWNAMQAHMDTIADAMAAAIARQFPQKTV